MALPSRVLVTSLVIYYIFLQLALRFGLIGPTMLDLKDNLAISYAAMSNAFSAMCIGICTGALSTGALSRLVPSRELSAFLLLLISASLVSSYTYWLDYRHFVGANFAVGVTTGAAIAICEAWILELWGKDCGPWMQALQFFRGLGYIIGPVLADPFLSLEVQVEESGREDLNSTESSSSLASSSTPPSSATEEFQNHNTNFVPYNSAIHTPYLINAGLLFLGAALLLGLYLYRLFKTSGGSCGGGRSTFDLTKGQSEQTIISASTLTIETVESSLAKVRATGTVAEVDTRTPSTASSSNSHSASSNTSTFSVAMITLASVFYLFFYEEVVVTYLPSYATQLSVQLTKSEASFLTSVFNFANLIGKAVGILLALKLSHLKMLYMNLTVMAASLGLLIAYADGNRTLLWVGVVLLGVGLSSIIASLYTLLEDTVQMSPLTCGILNMAGTSGSVITPLIIGPYMETNPTILMVVSLLYTALCTVLVIAMDLLMRFKGRIDYGNGKMFGKNVVAVKK